MAKRSEAQELMWKRAYFMSQVVLTRRRDLDIVPSNEHDYEVLIERHDNPDLWTFGVDVAGAESLPTEAAAVTGLAEIIRRQRSYQFVPAVALAFAMDDDRGWWAWTAEPVVGSDGVKELVEPDEQACRPLDDEAVDLIVQAVKGWHKARRPSAAPPRVRRRGVKSD